VVHANNRMLGGTHSWSLCEEYDDLLEMGTSIIAPLMVQYHNDKYGYWWELLHEIIFRRKTGAVEYWKDVLFENWAKYFNHGEHDQAPEYILSDLERRVRGEIVP
jgi:hypothetical protein